MKCFIDCKYESIYNVLKYFEKNTSLFEKIHYVELKNCNKILAVNNMSKISFKDLLGLYYIKEETVDNVDNLHIFLEKKLKSGTVCVVKTDLYYQDFSKKYFKKSHKKHNVFIKRLIKDKVEIIENEYADSEKYISMVVDIADLESWYYGYIKNYYVSKKDVADTVYLYRVDEKLLPKSDVINKILSESQVIKSKRNNIKIIKDYKLLNNTQKDKLVTYIGLLKSKNVEYVERNSSFELNAVLKEQITILKNICKNIIKNIDISDLLDRYLNLEEELIALLEKKDNDKLIIIRCKNELKILDNEEELTKYMNSYKNICLLCDNKVLIDISTNENMKNIVDIEVKDLINIITTDIKTYDYELNFDNIVESMRKDGYDVEHVNIQKNSINGYTKENIERIFFKILNYEQTKNELCGYIQIYNKIKTTKIKRIISYTNMCILIFEYKTSIKKNEGLLNDFFVTRDLKSDISKEDLKKINEVIFEYIKNISDEVISSNYPMNSFFEKRIKERLIEWYNDEDITIIIDNNSYNLKNIIDETINYFNNKRVYRCFISQGDPNVMNIGIEPFFFDFATSGYNPIEAEFSTIFWSILFNDLYYAPKYHKESYYNHERIFSNILKFTPKIKYNIDLDQKLIEINSYELISSNIRKRFIIDLIENLKEKNVYISENIIYFVIMRILCIFNINDMEEKDKIYSLCLLINIVNTIKKCNSKNKLDAVKEFVKSLGGIQ